MPLRVIATKVGLDGHDSGLQYVAQGLVRAGMEVIYLGKYHTAEEVASVAAHEDADVVAVSFLSGEYKTQVPLLRSALAEAGADGVRIVVGGLIDPEDEPGLQRDGADAVFGPGTDIRDVVAYLTETADSKAVG